MAGIPEGRVALVTSAGSGIGRVSPVRRFGDVYRDGGLSMHA